MIDPNDKAVWVPRGFTSAVKIKDDDIQMVPVEELAESQRILGLVRQWYRDYERSLYHRIPGSDVELRKILGPILEEAHE